MLPCQLRTCLQNLIECTSRKKITVATCSANYFRSLPTLAFAKSSTQSKRQQGLSISPQHAVASQKTNNFKPTPIQTLGTQNSLTRATPQNTKLATWLVVSAHLKKKSMSQRVRTTSHNHPKKQVENGSLSSHHPNQGITKALLRGAV